MLGEINNNNKFIVDKLTKKKNRSYQINLK